MIKLYGLAHCGSCKKAMDFLTTKGLSYQLIDIREQPPSSNQIEKALKSGIEPKRLLNTSGKLYRSGNYKETVKEMDMKEFTELLSNNPMLIKRPFLESGNIYRSGFKDSEYSNLK